MTKEEKLRYWGNKFFGVPKNIWSPQDLELIYEIYNDWHINKKIDTNCASCRRETILAIKQLWLNDTRTNKPTESNS